MEFKDQEAQSRSRLGVFGRLSARRRASVIGHGRRASSTADNQIGNDHPIHITVNRMGGDTLELDVDRSTTVAELKEQLGQRLEIPPLCQVLVLESPTLNQSAMLPNEAGRVPLHRFVPHPCESGGEVSVAEQSLTLMLVVSYNQSTANLADRMTAIAALTKTGCVSMLLMLMEDTNPDVREAALVAIAAVAPEGDEHALAAAGASLEDLSVFVRRASLQVLIKIGSKGDERILACIARGLRHENAGVRHTAVEALGAMVENGDIQAVGSLMGCLRDRDFGVRAAAARNVALVAEAKDALAISALTALRNDPEGPVRKQVAKALKTLSRG